MPEPDSPISVEEIGALPDDELDDRLWLRLAGIIDYSDPASLQAEDPDIAAYLSTRLFEWEVGNGGLHQYFFNFPSPDLLAVVLEGYSRLGLDDTRRLVEEVVAPLAQEEAAWRDSLRDGTIDTFFDSYVVSRLPEYDDRIGFHDEERISLARSNPKKFAQ